mgnify:CR=1 FL=1
MKAIRSFLFVLTGAIFLSACTSNPLMNINDRQVPNRLDGTVQSQESMKNGIIAGCIDKGWTCREVSPGRIAASITVRKHRADADISYDSDSYSITYKDSQLLDYNSKRQTIHRNYNRWIANLDSAITKRLVL